jgi:uncharacterized repeat protein (TIGR01451 family)
MRDKILNRCLHAFSIRWVWREVAAAKARIHPMKHVRNSVRTAMVLGLLGILSFPVSAAETVDVLVNGDFDAGPGLPWVEDDGGIGSPLIVTNGEANVSAQSGTYLLWLGGVTGTEMSASQDIVVPASVSNLHLTGYRMITSEDWRGNDRLTIEVYSSEGLPLELLGEWTDMDPASGWTAFDAPLVGDYAGQTIRLQITGSNDSIYPTSFYIDTLVLEGTLIPDLSVVNSGPADVVVGQGYTYSLTVENTGPVDALGVVLQDQLPAGMSFVGASPSQGSCGEQQGIVTCDLLDIPDGGSVTVEIQVLLEQAMLSNIATVSSASGDGNPSNSRAVALSDVDCNTPSSVPNTVRYETGMSQNTPNPFNPLTTIPFAVDRAGRVRIDIFDTRGRLVRSLADRRYDTGVHAVEWNGRDGGGGRVASGVYYYEMHIDGRLVDTRKAVMLK